jgi:hypothetical protein
MLVGNVILKIEPERAGFVNDMINLYEDIAPTVKLLTSS